MVSFKTIYRTDLLLVSLISSSYDVHYSSNDYNPLPAVSFPVKSGFRYISGNFDSIIDTNTILLEAEGTEFTVSKFSEFQHDITLTFQFCKKDFELFSRLIQPKKTVESFSRTPQIEYLIKSLLMTYPKGEAFLMDQIISDLLFREVVDLPSSVIRIKAIKPWENIKIDVAKEYIHSFCSEKISLFDISSSCHISPFHFSRMFKRKTGYSPYEYLMWVRIAKAKQLLRKNTSITNVAFEVGFNSLENFSYAFRKMVGISPIQYKMSNISKPY